MLNRETIYDVAIIGAGLSGLVCAQHLKQQGLNVVIVDKGRSVAGRMSTRRYTETDLQFDHGAQYFTARDPKFQQFLKPYLQSGVVAEWAGRFVELESGNIQDHDDQPIRYAGVPGMNSLCKAISSELAVIQEVRVESVSFVENRWHLVTNSNESLSAHRMVCAIPPAQASELLRGHSKLSHQCSQSKMAPCWAVMAAFSVSLNLDFCAAFVNQNPLRWVANDSSKPGRQSSQECWVLHASPEWSEEYLECDQREIPEELLKAFSEATDMPIPEPDFVTAHRWRYALPLDSMDGPCLHDPVQLLTICGDWCHGSRVEGAFLSGLAAAESILQAL